MDGSTIDDEDKCLEELIVRKEIRSIGEVWLNRDDMNTGTVNREE